MIAELLDTALAVVREASRVAAVRFEEGVVATPTVLVSNGHLHDDLLALASDMPHGREPRDLDA